MIRTSILDLPPLFLGIFLGWIYAYFFYSNELLSKIAIFFGLKSSYFICITFILFIYTLIKKPLEKETSLLVIIFFNFFSLKNGLLCITGFLCFLGFYSLKNNLNDYLLFFTQSIYIYFLVCCIRLLEEYIFSQLINHFKPYFQQIIIRKQ